MLNTKYDIVTILLRATKPWRSYRDVLMILLRCRWNETVAELVAKLFQTRGEATARGDRGHVVTHPLK